MSLYMCIYIYNHIHIHTCTCESTYVLMRNYTCIYIYMYIHIKIYTYLFVWVLSIPTETLGLELWEFAAGSGGTCMTLWLSTFLVNPAHGDYKSHTEGLEHIQTPVCPSLIFTCHPNTQGSYVAWR